MSKFNYEKDFGEQLREWRWENNLTQAELAKLMKCSLRTINRNERHGVPEGLSGSRFKIKLQKIVDDMEAIDQWKFKFEPKPPVWKEPETWQDVVKMVYRKSGKDEDDADAFILRLEDVDKDEAITLLVNRLAEIIL